MIRQLGVALALALATPAQAGWFAAPEASWSSFSFEPTHGEVTPNYYGIGLGLSAGYSVSQAFDLGIYGQDLPGRLHAAQFGKGDATLVSYGGELAWRFADTVYFGLHGGLTQYDLKTQTDPTELPGRWSGPSGGLALGAVTRLSKSQFIQATFELTEAVVADASNQGLGKRKLDQFAFGLTWAFIGEGRSHLIESGIFKDFLDTLVF